MIEKYRLHRDKFISLLFVIFMTGSLTANAQQTISGTVTDAQSGETLPGVNILVKGTTQGTATGPKGAYKLSVPSLQDTLVFSFVGFKTKQVPIQSRTTINISISSQTISGEEMVVTGYLNESKKDLVGSISSVSSEDLQQSNTNNVANMLQGKTSGVYISQSSGEPGSDPVVLIRGMGSISAGNSPLYVVDGIITDSYNNVAPQDIKSVDVLKGPAATSIYGSRASNGVVVITTKSGDSEGETNFDVGLSAGVANALKGNLHFMNSNQLIDYYKRMGQTPPVDPDTMGHTDWWNLMFDPAVHQKYNVSASGGDKDDQFYIAGNFFKDDGTRIQDSYSRYSGRVNYKHIFSDRFTINTRLNGRFDKHSYETSGNALFAAYQALPWDKPFKDDGSIRKGITGVNWISRDVRNPLYADQYNFNHIRYNDFFINVDLSYDLTDHFILTSNNSTNFSNRLNEAYNDPRTIYGASDNGSLNNSNGYSNNIETSNLLKYKQSFNRNNINAVLGFEFQKEHGSNFGATGTGIDGFDILDVTANAKDVYGGKYEYNFISQFLQAKYNYNSTYYFTGSFRRDGSSRFGSDKRYGNFYAMGGAWMLSNESFFHADFIDQLKLRVGYGITGNAQIGNYAAQSLQDYGIKYNGTSASFPSNLGNEALTWEKQHDWQVGIDLSIFNSRLDVTLDGYQKKNENLLHSVPLPLESGFTEQLQNIGSVRNRGLEATISTVNIQAGDFLWSTDLNITFNKNKVLNLYEGEPIIEGNKIIEEGGTLGTWYMPEWAGVNPENGDPQWEKVTEGPNGKKQVELTSNYNEATRQKIGPSIPEWYGGITNRFQYKGFSLYALFTYMGGYNLYSGIFAEALSDGRYTTWNQLDLSDYSRLSRWENTGDQATAPKLVFGGNKNSNALSTRFLMNGNHLQLKELKLGYELPVGLSEQLGLKTVKFYIDGGNLWTLTTLDYIGPDPQEGLDPFESRGGKYPNSRTFMFGLDLKF